MAIIPAVQGVKVEVYVDGAALVEFDDPSYPNESVEHEVTRYVTAQPGKNFAIRYKFEKAFFGTLKTALDARVKLCIDGQPVDRQVVRAKSSHRLDTRVVDGQNQYTSSSGWMRSKFTFMDVAFDDNQNLPKSKDEIAKLQDMGTICVQIERGHVGKKLRAGTSAKRPSKTTASDFKPIGKLNEKSLKGNAISCTTTMTNAVPITAPISNSYSSWTSMGKSQLVFRFKYRSLNDLKAEMIIPRSPSPLPIEERPVDALTRVELEELVRRQRAAGPFFKKELKRERSQPASFHGAEDLSVIEPPPKRHRQIMTIDLTDD